MPSQVARAAADAGIATARPVTSYAERKRRRRQGAIERLQRRVRRPVDLARRQRDPLRRGRRSVPRRAARFLRYAALTLFVHVAGFVLLVKVGDFTGPAGAGERPTELVTLELVDPPPLPAPDIETAPSAPSEPPPRLAVEQPDPPARKRTPRRAPAPLPADPIDAAEPARPSESKPVRRVVGLSLESTVTSGSGPAFAVGNTRMGQTGEVAAEPSRIGRLGSAAKGSGKSSSGSGVNQVASVVPGSSVQLTKPRRIGKPSLAYPAVLKAQGIEGNVAVMIRIAEDGSVISVRVLESSGYAEFDRAAREAALKERFAPATRDGDPVQYTLKYTYRFRIKPA